VPNPFGFFKSQKRPKEGQKKEKIWYEKRTARLYFRAELTLDADVNEVSMSDQVPGLGN
jgi:hypothetical protein